MAKVLELHLQHQSFHWIFRIDFLRTDWLVFLAVFSRILKNLLQNHNLKESVLQCSAFFMVQLVAQTVSICLQCGDLGPIPLSGRSPGEGNGNPLQYSCLENPMDRGCLVSYNLRDHKESDMTEQLHFSHICSLLENQGSGYVDHCWQNDVSAT